MRSVSALASTSLKNIDAFGADSGSAWGFKLKVQEAEGAIFGYSAYLRDTSKKVNEQGALADPFYPTFSGCASSMADDDMESSFVFDMLINVGKVLENFASSAGSGGPYNVLLQQSKETQNKYPNYMLCLGDLRDKQNLVFQKGAGPPAGRLKAGWAVLATVPGDTRVRVLAIPATRTHTKQRRPVLFVDTGSGIFVPMRPQNPQHLGSVMQLEGWMTGATCDAQGPAFSGTIRIDPGTERWRARWCFKHARLHKSRMTALSKHISQDVV